MALNRIANFMLTGEILEFGKYVPFWGYELRVNEFKKPKFSNSQDGHIVISLYITFDRQTVSFSDFYLQIIKDDSEGIWISPNWRNPSCIVFDLKNCSAGTLTLELAKTIDILGKQHEQGNMESYYLENKSIIEELYIIGCFKVNLTCENPNNYLVKTSHALPPPITEKKTKTVKPEPAEVKKTKAVNPVQIKKQTQSLNLFPLVFWFSAFSLLYDLLVSKLLYVFTNIEINSIYILIHIILMFIFNSVLVKTITKIEN